MEAGALRAPPTLNRISVTAPLLRLRSDEQLVALFRAGNDAAFSVIHDRYRQRLFAYARQMLGGSRQDAEDALQDVFLRAYSSLRSNDRPLSLRAWLYRVAHNRCIDHLRRPTPPASDLFDTSRKPLHDPMDELVRREDLRQLVEDVRRLPAQQRSALLMREMDGMSYAELAEALGVSMQAVKSLLVRARIGLVEAVEARDTACAEIRLDLTDAYDRGVRASGLARRHLRDCKACGEYKTQLRVVHQGLAILGPGGSGPLGAVLKLIGLGGAGSAGAASAGGGAAAGGGTLAAVTSGTAAKIVAVACGAALTASGAVEVREQIIKSTGLSSGTGTRVGATAAAAAPLRKVTPAINAATAAGAVPAAAKHEVAEPDSSTASVPTDGRHTPVDPAEPDPTAPAVNTAARSETPADANTGGASAPGEEDGFGLGVDGLEVRTPQEPSSVPAADPVADPVAEPGLVTGSSTGETGGGPAPPAGAVTAGDESSSVGTAGSAKSASGTLTPG
jgi:RNA polymerase sigma factor (sigma-70 family)